MSQLVRQRELEFLEVWQFQLGVALGQMQLWAGQPQLSPLFRSWLAWLAAPWVGKEPGLEV